MCTRISVLFLSGNLLFRGEERSRLPSRYIKLGEMALGRVSVRAPVREISRQGLARLGELPSVRVRASPQLPAFH